MIYAPHHEYSASQMVALGKARRLEWWSLGYMTSVVILMYLVMGTSQAMKSAWIGDVLTMIPPLAFLISSRVCWRKPTHDYPYGYHRSVALAFLMAAVALLAVGAYIFVDSLATLITAEHPTLGTRDVAGHDVWLGWLMLAVLAWATVIPVFLGHAKLKLAYPLNDKVLYTDAKMNKADWMTGVTAGLGVVGIGVGWWWADAVAALVISVDILKDGVTQTIGALTGLMNRAPVTLEGQPDPLPDRVRDTLERLDWVDQAAVRLSEHGHLILGEGFVTLRGCDSVTAAQLADAMAQVSDLDWRLRGFALSVLPEAPTEHTP